MKTKWFGLTCVTILTVLSLGGCGCFMQQMAGETAPPPAPQAQTIAPEAKEVIPVPQAAPAPVVAAGPVAAAAVASALLTDINFDFDKYNIRPGDAEILTKDFEWFKANPGKKARIEGHCDERGTVEYNLVLGQKRADSAKAYLINLGVDGKLLETISYGKEKPLDPGHNEGAWAKNRRVHFAPVN
jgi:peptidoglycan-associated lipoprotein